MCEPVVGIVASPQEFSEAQHLPSILGNLEELNEEQQQENYLKNFRTCFRPLTLLSAAAICHNIELIQVAIHQSSNIQDVHLLQRKKKQSVKLKKRKLNEITKKDSRPLPRIDGILDALNGNQWLTTLSLKSKLRSDLKIEKRQPSPGQGLWQFKEPEGQIARWIQRLQEYDFEIQHRNGTSRGNLDSLSRRPCKESCKHCTNAEKKFGMETDISVKVLTTTTVDP
ncbi:hypothetical protein AVEN_195520-1 [Araneus ventricosus]|uniref:Uncharacterized protein n=1 Tax=Araneus ventricosus TaxID=182803 RepID=A0A4Y2J014_ARAVE|nr:hypothetical protein AVEN_195520-1 [Araneus ventricosus]